MHAVARHEWGAHFQRAPASAAVRGGLAVEPEARLLFYVLLGDRIVRGAHRQAPVLKPPPPMIPPSAVYAVLPPWVDQLYKAAGVLAYSYDETGRLVFLLAEEARLSKQSRGRASFWNLLGGKRERVDRFVEDTAVREFIEETAGAGAALREALIASLASAECLKLWQAEGKFVLFLTPLPYDPAFPALFAAAAQHQKLDPETCITKQIRWVAAAEVLAASYPDHYPVCGDVGSFYPFLLQILRIEGARNELARLYARQGSAPVWRMASASAPPPTLQTQGGVAPFSGRM